MAEKKYLSGSGKEITFDDGNSIINIYIDLDDAKEKGLIFKTPKGKNGLAFTLAKKSEVGEYGDTHYMYHKDRAASSSGAKKAVVKTAAPTAKAPSQSSSDDLPF